VQNILIISHKEQQCGVHQYGKNIAEVLKNSRKYNFLYEECSNAKELIAHVQDIKPEAIIYNYYPSTLPWLTRRLMWKIKAPHVGIMHEVTQQAANAADSSFFQFHIAPDPTLLLTNPLVFKTGRLIPAYTNKYALPHIPTVGSFGFGTQGKGFQHLISTVQKEFDAAIIRLNIPFAAFGDADGSEARLIARECRELITKKDIQLQLTHDFLSQSQLLDFLAQNSINAFFYEENKGRGISSVIDHALAVQRPIVITKSTMFRHVSSVYPSICIEDSRLKEIIGNGFEPIRHFFTEWSEANLIWDYERALDKILAAASPASFSKYVYQRIKKALRKIEPKSVGDYWVPNIGESVKELPRTRREGFIVNSLSNATSLNRILDKSARELYKPTIDKLFELLPDMMSRKIPEANVQQAFVLDTVLRSLSRFSHPRLLCIGSYDDTAAAALKIMGRRIAEVDPVLNYDLSTFCSRPSTKMESYDIVFSTSVLEHINNDEQFMAQIAGLLAPGGVAILTVDFNDQYRPGNCIPHEDFRLYTQRDFKERLLPLMKNCVLVDTPDWACTSPDFTYSGCRYTFASFVVTKNKT